MINITSSLPSPSNNILHSKTAPTKSNAKEAGTKKITQWLRAAVLGANDGLVSVSSVIMGVGEKRNQSDVACRQRKTGEKEEDGEKVDKLPNPLQAAMASAFAFSVGGLVPLMAAEFIREYKVRIAVVVMVASLALVVCGGVGLSLV
ncbi:hypothetical protein FNV43_RR22092 [Rhamnella rubrinervis]|uniref:Vacuolar iron transporter n=1 Tax=Rhamnella rubrinervis TaxID=2594499 RepID=A0A8K0DPU2_9ROSA|nr:hypothetical protein FNV43_RR22092 [Rhamnella rubrinervis]